MRTACKKDKNHAAIENIFLAYGLDVIDTSGYSGKMLDLLVTLSNGFFQYIEIKDGSKPKSQRKLTEAEKEFIAKRPDQCTVIESVAQAQAFCAHIIAGNKF